MRQQTDNNVSSLSFKMLERTSFGLNLFQFSFCLSRLTEATVMCFDQCHSGSADRPAYHRRLPTGFCYHLYVCMCTCVCVWWQMRGGSHRARKDRADNLESLSSGRLSLTWALLHVPHAHCPDTRWDHLSSLSDANTYTPHARIVYMPGGILKSFSVRLRKSLALMLISVGGTTHNGERGEREGGLKNEGELQKRLWKIWAEMYRRDQCKGWKYLNGEEKKSRWRMKRELKQQKRFGKTQWRLLQQHGE